jgi:hypothetical protein
MNENSSTTTTLGVLSFFPEKKRFVTMNKKVAVSPFPDMSVKTSAQGQGAVKVGRIENKVKLVELSVVFPSEDGRFMSGYKVLVRGDLYLQSWAKEIQEFDGCQYILVPESFVEALIRE